MSGQSAGSTRWSTPVIDARPDGSARIALNVTYTQPSGQVDMTETRVLNVSATDADGGFTIDWDMHFTAGSAGAVLDRTAMPGEPNGAFNGGYAGLSARLTAAPVVMSVVSADSNITLFERDRARPATSAIAGNLTMDGKDVGGVAHPERRGQHRRARAMVHHQRRRLSLSMRRGAGSRHSHAAAGRRVDAALSGRATARCVDSCRTHCRDDAVERSPLGQSDCALDASHGSLESHFSSGANRNTMPPSASFGNNR